MSNLIILVVSVILLGIMGAITMDYLGTGVTATSTKANASGLVAQAMQIVSAHKMFLFGDTNTSAQSNLSHLTIDNLLSRVPINDMGTWSYSEGLGLIYMESAQSIFPSDVCDKVNTMTASGIGDVENQSGLFECMTDIILDEVDAEESDLSGVGSNIFVFRL